MVVSFITASLLQEEMVYTSLHCCDKTTDDKIAIYREQWQFEHDEILFGVGFDVLFSELYKTMVNKVTFLGFRVGDRPPLKPPCLEGALVPKMSFFGSNAFFSHTLVSGT